MASVASMARQLASRTGVGFRIHRRAELVEVAEQAQARLDFSGVIQRDIEGGGVGWRDRA